jgi:hypothetical protein
MVPSQLGQKFCETSSQREKAGRGGTHLTACCQSTLVRSVTFGEDWGPDWPQGEKARPYLQTNQREKG